MEEGDNLTHGQQPYTPKPNKHNVKESILNSSYLQKQEGTLAFHTGLRRALPLPLERS